MAAVSWHFIERPLLRKRVALFDGLGRRLGRLETASPPRARARGGREGNIWQDPEAEERPGALEAEAR